MPPLSAVVITRNEEKNIARCLRSLHAVTDDIVVVDARSTDRTADIARSEGARVLSHDWEGYAAAKNRGNEQALNDLILSVDADEVVSDELARAIGGFVQRGGAAGRMRRKTNFCGTWIRHGAWYPDIKLRLFDRRNFRWTGDVHETLEGPSRAAELLPGHLLHFSYTSVDEFVDRQRHYARLGALALHRRNTRPGAAAPLLKPAIRFFRDYVLRAGFLDGAAGFLIARVTAQAVYWKYAELKRLAARPA